jgi:hypothetical protein
MITRWWNEGDKNQRTLQNLNSVQIVLNKAANSETEPLVESNLHVNIQIKMRNESNKRKTARTLQFMEYVIQGDSWVYTPPWCSVPILYKSYPHTLGTFYTNRTEECSAQRSNRTLALRPDGLCSSLQLSAALCSCRDILV